MKTIGKKILTFQMKMKPVTKDGTNDFVKGKNGVHKYSTLDSILAIVKPILNELQMIITQPILDGSVITEITDIESGESIKSELKLPDGISPQQMGSAITYFRRYTLLAALSLETEDDDGHAATLKTVDKKTEQPVQQQQAASTTPAKKWLNPKSKDWDNAVEKLFNKTITTDIVKQNYNITKTNAELLLKAVEEYKPTTTPRPEHVDTSTKK